MDQSNAHLAASGLSQAKPRVEGRPFDAVEEVRRRQRNIVLLGLLLLAGFFMPVLAPEVIYQFRWNVVFPNIQSLVTSDDAWEKVILAQPLAAGLVLLLFARRTRPHLRGSLLILLGVVPAAALLLLPDFSIYWQQIGSHDAAPAVISAVLLLSGVCGLFVGARTRFYRPSHMHAYSIGALGALAGLAFWIVPIDGMAPIVVPVQAFESSAIGGIGALLALGLFVLACIICLANTPGQPVARASKRAALAFRSLCGSSAIVPITAVIAGTIMAMHWGEGPMIAVVAALGAIKTFMWVGGLALLLPVGLTDLLVGQPVTDPNACAACGYDLRACTDPVCPECGQRTC